MCGHGRNRRLRPVHPPVHPVERRSRRRATRGRIPGLSFGVFVLLAACAAPVKTTSTGSAALPSSGDERIVVYPPLPCLAEALGKRPELKGRLLETATFQDALFPWFEPGAAPTNAEDFERLLAKPHLRARIDSLSVRYLISPAERVEEHGFPGVLCGAGYGAVGCFGLAWNSEKTSLDAVMWDLRRVEQAGALSVDSAGTSVIIGIFSPIMFIADTEHEACAKLADAIVAPLTGGSSGGAPE